MLFCGCAASGFSTLLLGLGRVLRPWDLGGREVIDRSAGHALQQTMVVSCGSARIETRITIGRGLEILMAKKLLDELKGARRVVK